MEEIIIINFYKYLFKEVIRQVTQTTKKHLWAAGVISNHKKSFEASCKPQNTFKMMDLHTSMILCCYYNTNSTTNHILLWATVVCEKVSETLQFQNLNMEPHMYLSTQYLHVHVYSYIHVHVWFNNACSNYSIITTKTLIIAFSYTETS